MSDPIETWRACDAPTRPLRWGAVFCDCATCAATLHDLAADEPDRLLGVKFGVARRLLVAAGVLARVGFHGDDIATRYGEGDDWVRELWLADPDSGYPEAMSPGEANLLELMRDHAIPPPEWNVEVDLETGQRRPAGARRVTR